MATLLPCVEIGPAPEAASGVVIWLHGLGADGHDFEPIVPMLRRDDLRFVLPHAPRRPVTINMGFVMPSWYDIKTLEPSTSRESVEDIETSARDIAALIERERSQGVPADRIVVVGFSQGGAMALHVGLRYPETLAGLASLSAYLLEPVGLAAPPHAGANAQTPILFCHGTNDPLVAVESGKAARAKLSSDERATAWHEFPMEHEVCPEEVGVIRSWLGRVLPPP